MSNISESIPDLLGGVSQLAPQRRQVNEVESMVNCQVRPAEGVVKRPPTKWIAEVAASAAAYSGALVHPINKNANERFWVIVLDGDLKVFNASTGVEETVTFPNGKSYLDVVNSPNESFRLSTFNDTTVIVNRETTVTRGTTLSSSRGDEALLVVTQTDFDVWYSLQIDFAGPVLGGPPTLNVIEYWTPSADPANLRALNTSEVASQLLTLANAKWGTGGTGLLTFSRFGSVIHITPGPNLPAANQFWIAPRDGLADAGLEGIQESVQRIESLPTEAPIGFRIKVEGDPEKSLDDVFYEFTAGGAWDETTEDGIPIALDPATLPLELVRDPDLLGSSIAGTDAEAPAASHEASQISTYSAGILQTADGATSTAGQRIVSPAPAASTDRFLNLASANGSDVVLTLDLLLDETRIVGPGVDPTDPAGGFYGGDSFDIIVALDTGGGYSDVLTLPFNSWQVNSRQFTQDIPLSSVTANSDVRIRVTSAAPNLGALIVTHSATMAYTVEDGVKINCPTAHYAPGTVMSFTLNGTSFSDTFTAGGTRDEYRTRLKTQIEAYGGVAVTVTLTTGAFGGPSAIIITNDSGSVPTIASFVFDDNLNLFTQFFNGAADFVTAGVGINDTISNTTDGSSAVISAVAATVITSGALAGGAANAWANGDTGNVTAAITGFVCREADWGKRLVGTEETNKWPAFDNQTINEAAFLKNRLVFLSDENVAMSEVDEFFNFFRSSTLNVLDSDRIDVALSGNKASALHSAFVWNETLLTWSELGQFVVNGEPFLSPNTVKREATTSYLNTRKVRPVTSERSVYFLTEGNEYCQLWDYRPTAEDATSAEGNRLSVQVPRYMPGLARGVLAVSDPEIVLVLTATDPDELYVFSHLIQEQERSMAAWHKWAFAGVTQILGMGSIDNEISLILERDDGKVHLEVLDAWELSDAVLDGQQDSDDHAVPPTFEPTALAKDRFAEAAQAFLTAHTPDRGFLAWETNVTETGDVGAHCSVTGATSGTLIMNLGGTSGLAYRNTADIGDGDLHLYVDMKRTSTGAGQFPFGSFLVRADEASYKEGLGVSIDGEQSTHIRIKAERWDNNNLVETANVGSDVALAGGASIRIGMRLAGNVATFYTADAGTGANEASQGTFTFGSQSTTGLIDLTDGSHQRVHIFNEGSQSPLTNAWEFDNLTIEAVGAVSDTTYTPPLDPTIFPPVGVDPSGECMALTDNGDGTASWPGEDKTGVNVTVGIAIASSIVLSQLYHRKNFGPHAGQAETRGEHLH